MERGPTMEVKTRILRDMEDNANLSRVYDFYSWEEILQNDDLRRNNIGFTTVMYNPNDGLLYCGISSFENDILYTFDPETKEFRSLRFHEADGAEKYDVKVHRSLCLDDDGTIYGATACLHTLREYMKAPGGKLFRYDPKADRIEILAIPLPHLYVQTIALDKKRKIIYGCTYPVAHIFRYDILENKTKDLGAVAFPPHRPVVDADGNLWACYECTFPPADPGLELLRYNPDEDKVYYGPWPESCKMVRKQIDDMVLGPDDMIYIGCVSGELVRLDPRKEEMQYLGKPFATSRLDVAFDQEGRLFVASGYGSMKSGGARGKDTAIFAYDLGTRAFDFYGYIYDPEARRGCVMVHDLAITDQGIAYVAESDNLTRSCHLWECTLK